MTVAIETSRRRATMRDVARVAGVSPTTVSFVINDVAGTNIPDATRRRVWAAVEHLGYRPNETARQLRTQRSRTIGFVMDGANGPVVDTPFLGALILGAQDAAWERGHLLTVATTDGDPDSEVAALNTLVSRRVDGVLFVSLSQRIVTPPSALSDLPAVMLNCSASDGTFPSVNRDDMEDGRRATEIVLRKGHRRIAVIDSSPTPTPGVVPGKHDRLAGYYEALTSFYAPFDARLAVQCDGTSIAAHDAVLDLFRLPQPPTAIICGTEDIALGVYDALREKRMTIPRDVAVIAFTGRSAIANALRPTLSTMTFPFAEMGAWAARYLTDHLELSMPLAPERYAIASHYEERGST